MGAVSPVIYQGFSFVYQRPNLEAMANAFAQHQLFSAPIGLHNRNSATRVIAFGTF